MIGESQLAARHYTVKLTAYACSNPCLQKQLRACSVSWPVRSAVQAALQHCNMMMIISTRLPLKQQAKGNDQLLHQA
eukprot:9595-Heterococcus_DN1.PRE.1